MPSASPLSEYEKGQIDVLKRQGCSQRQIAKEINRSATVVHNYIRLGENYGASPRSGRPPSLDERAKRRVLRLVSDGNHSCSQILAETKLNVSSKTINRVIKESGFFEYSSMDVKPKLTDQHKKNRLVFARNHMTWSDEWLSVIFSDEKKFNLDGPDGLKCYWHDIRADKRIFSKRNFGGGTVMVWGAFSFNGVLPIVKITPSMNSSDYIKVIGENLIPNSIDYAGSDFIFQQDNARIHVSKESKKFFADNSVKLLPWPACSPDLNPIENLWGVIARRVYANQRQFNKVDDLWGEIQKIWYDLEPELLQNLISSMKNRIFDVIRLNGGQIDY